ncbi:hypothetical protein [Paludibaculum fermentans]|uniref:PadR family transcriptional regulator n=1 Tax=Paludibaculum fermentans TaxID=1473598 RepID=A0A7S7NPH2_PALFE|nr:hypothetical protein [Paludibaculum fermentans]QOY87387.1 hypothetical protein IRI77_32265 [Paludibaculum fermentans]
MPATLYTTIQRLLEHSLTEEVEGPDDADSRRRYHRVTTDGSAALRLELDRMAASLAKTRSMSLRTAEPR